MTLGHAHVRRAKEKPLKEANRALCKVAILFPAPGAVASMPPRAGSSLPYLRYILLVLTQCWPCPGVLRVPVALLPSGSRGPHWATCTFAVAPRAWWPPASGPPSLPQAYFFVY